ncbi:unnamed protein product [Discula destructiva]
MSEITWTFSTPPCNGTHWYYIGRNRGSDIHIPDEGSISGCHIQVGFDSWGQVVLKDTSRLGCVFWYNQTTSTPDSANTRNERGQSAQSDGNKDDPPTWVVPVGWTLSAKLGDSSTRIDFQVPDHSDHLDQYHQRIAAFQKTQNNPISFLGGLALDSQRATTRGLLSAAHQEAQQRRQNPNRYAWIVSDKRIGGGTFGDVYEVFNTRNWCMCAGKRMKIESTFQNESSVMRRLNHPHIVQYVDVEESSLSHPSMIIMEYYPLGDLSSQHKAKRFSQHEIIKIIAQTASALTYLHGERVAHRDLKPANILVRSRKPVEIAVTDFGVS